MYQYDEQLFKDKWLGPPGVLMAALLTVFNKYLCGGCVQSFTA